MMESQQNQKHKNKNRLYFIVGLTTGLVLSVVLYLIHQSIFKQTLYFFKADQSASEISPVDSDSAEINIPKEFQKIQPVSSKPSQDSLLLDSADLASYDPGLDEVDFMLEVPEEKDIIASDKIIARKRLKVQYKKDTQEADSLTKTNYFQYFDVEQWNSPIKNKISYWRKNNSLKVKGLEISQIEVYFTNGEYYMHYGNRRFILRNNNTFEKLEEVNPVN